LSNEKLGALFTRIGALQKDVVLLKPLAIRLHNVDLQPLWPFGLCVANASVMPDLVARDGSPIY
jgi:hypothetical protein